MSPKLLNILLVIIPITMYFGVFDPLYNGSPGLVWQPGASIFSLQSQNIQYTNALNQLTLVKTSAEKVNKSYTSVSDETKEKLSTLLPDKLESLRLRNEVITIASKAGIALAGVSVVQDLKPTIAGLGSYTVTFAVRARYPVFKKFIEGYEKSQRLFIIESLSIKLHERTEKEARENPQVDDKEMLDITVRFKVYYLK